MSLVTLRDDHLAFGKDCSRIRQSLMQYSWAQRIRLHRTEQTQRVTKSEIPAGCPGFESFSAAVGHNRTVPPQDALPVSGHSPNYSI